MERSHTSRNKGTANEKVHKVNAMHRRMARDTSFGFPTTAWLFLLRLLLLLPGKHVLFWKAPVVALQVTLEFLFLLVVVLCFFFWSFSFALFPSSSSSLSSSSSSYSRYPSSSNNVFPANENASKSPSLPPENTPSPPKLDKNELLFTANVVISSLFVNTLYYVVVVVLNVLNVSARISCFEEGFLPRPIFSSSTESY